MSRNQFFVLAIEVFHPNLPVILTGSEDGTCRVWHSATYRLESTLTYLLERLWSISCVKGPTPAGRIDAHDRRMIEMRKAESWSSIVFVLPIPESCCLELCPVELHRV